MSVPPQKFKFVMQRPALPGKRGAIETDAFEATPRQAAKFATDSIARSGGSYSMVRVQMNGSEVMTCYGRIYRKSERAKAKRGPINDRTIAYCDIAPGFKQLLASPNKRKRRRK